MKVVYYAHHMWKYGSLKEKEELEFIESKFKDYFVISPSKWIANLGEPYGMNQCLHMVRNSNILVFTSLSDGIIGKGVYEEIEMAFECGLEVYYLDDGEFIPFTRDRFSDNVSIVVGATETNRKYAKVK